MCIRDSLASKRGPDITVLVLVENAASMPLAHRKAMGAAMGDLDPEWAVKMNAGDHVASPRERLWIGNFPPPADTITYTRLPSPWEPTDQTEGSRLGRSPGPPQATQTPSFRAATRLTSCASYITRTVDIGGSSGIRPN
eukprot:7922628-Pyramimonas_sp.AAC.1